RIAHAYERRPTTRHGVRDVDGWRLREWRITLPGETLDQAAFEAGLALASTALPHPPAAEGRVGAGFVIFHQGRGVDYVVLCWWSRENELPIRVFVRERAPNAQWRPGRGEESVCVWDLEVIRRERDAWVKTVL